MRLLVPGVAALLVGCAAPTMLPPVPPGAFAPLSLAEFPGAAALLEGFDPRTGDADWAASDRLLFGLQLDGDGDSVRWLLLVELPLGQRLRARAPDGSERLTAGGPVATWRFQVQHADGPREITIESRLVAARARVFTGAGELLTDTEDTLPTDVLAHGLVAAVEHARDATGHARDAGTTPVPDRTMLEGLLAVQRLLEIVRGNDALADYFWRVVEKPSVWSVLTHFGVDVSVDFALERSAPVGLPAPLPPGPPSYAVPLRIDVNGSPALFVDLLASDAQRPYALCGGIVAAIARHPTRPERTFRMQLLAARLGPPARTISDPEPTAR